MGLSGPPPKPTALKRAEGNPGKRRLNDREPQPLEIAPRCPPHLDKLARQEWKRIVPILLQMRILTEADGMCLANLCQAWSTLIQAQTKLTGMGILYQAHSGYIMQSPLLSIVNSCVDTITRLSREFGLTPASRVRLTVIDGPEPGRPERMSSLEEILSMPMRERPKPPFVQ